MYDIQDAVLLEESKAELSSLVRSANAPIFQINMHGFVATCNPTFVALLGYESAERLVGLPLNELVPAESHAAVEAVLAAALRGEDAEGFELVLQSVRGQRSSSRTPSARTHALAAACVRALSSPRGVCFAVSAG